LVLGVDPETEHRDRTAITIIGRVDDQLIVEREPRRCHQEAVIGFEDSLGAGMGQLPVADQNAEPAVIEKLLVYLGDAIDDAGDTEGVVVASPFLSGNRKAAGNRPVDISEVIRLDIAIGPAGTGKKTRHSASIAAQGYSKKVGIYLPGLFAHPLLHSSHNRKPETARRELFQKWSYTPARGRNGWFEAEAADHLFENRVALHGRGELRGHFDAAAFCKIGAVETPQAELAAASALQQQSADMRLLGISADDANAVTGIGFCLRDRLAVDDTNQRPQRQIDKNDKEGRQRGVQRMAASRKQSDRCRTPQRRCGVQPGHLKSFAKDNSRTEK